MNEFWGFNVQHSEYIVITWWLYMVSLVAQMVKNLPAMWGNRVQSLGREDFLEKDMATHPSILAWRIPRTKEPSRLQFIGSQRVGHDWVTNTFKMIILIVNKRFFQVFPSVCLSWACVLTHKMCVKRLVLSFLILPSFHRAAFKHLKGQECHPSYPGPWSTVCPTCTLLLHVVSLLLSQEAPTASSAEI